MSQHDYVLDNAAGAAFRADLNAALLAIVSMNSGATAPATTYAHMPWWDTATGKFKIRNAANTAWLLVSSLGDAEAATLTNKTIAAATNAVEARSGPDTSAFSHRNKIINGDFRINQRSYVSGAAVGANLYGHDRWKMAASADTYTFSTANNKTTITIPAGKVLQQVIEGLNLQTGTYCLSWEGTAQGKIGAGSYGASGITGSITGGGNTTIEFGPGTVSNVQLEAGSVATPFEHRPYGVELALCHRYYEKSYDDNTSPGAATASSITRFPVGAANTALFGAAQFKVTKRSTPTMTVWDAAGNLGRMSAYAASDYTRTDNINALASGWQGNNSWGFSASTTTFGAACTYACHWTASSEL